MEIKGMHKYFDKRSGQIVKAIKFTGSNAYDILALVTNNNNFLEHEDWECQSFKLSGTPGLYEVLIGDYVVLTENGNIYCYEKDLFKIIYSYDKDIQ